MLTFFICNFVRKFNVSKYEELDFYQLAGVERESSTKEIKKAYSRYLKQKKHIEQPNNRVKDLWEKTDLAFDIIGNNYSKILYDLFSTSFMNLTDFKISGYQSDEAIEAMIKTMGRTPSDYFNFGGLIYYPIEFELEEFFEGAERTVTTLNVKDCVCPGGIKVCKKCDDSPFVEEPQEFVISLPKGANEFYRIVGGDYGDTGKMRGATDVVFVCTSKKHPTFERKGRDLLMNLTLSLGDVLSDDMITIIGIDGNDILVPAKGVQHLQKIVIPGQGMPDFFTPSKRGDLIITYMINMPSSLNEEQKSALSSVLPDDDSFYL